jgi:O-methyltransferase
MLRGLYHLAFNPRARAEWRWLVLTAITKRLMPGYRLPWPHMAWWNDEQFNAFLKRFDEYNGHNSERRWTIAQLCKLAKNVPGDTAECGVYVGTSSYLIATAFADRTHHGFDSFEGCSAPSGRDSGYFYTGTHYATLEQTKKDLNDCPNIRLYKGWIPERFSEVQDKRFAFVHIDVQQDQPTLDSLSFFYPRLNKGGIIAFDDYGFTKCTGARAAIDDFMADKPESPIELSSGTAFVTKSS